MGNAADTTVAHAPGAGGGEALSRLLDLPDPPQRLFVRGSLPGTRTWVAIVGSRAASPYGLAMASHLAADLARLELPIVSGLARGIDAAAHRAALDAGGRTVAVLPGGVDTIVPGFHRELAVRIVAHGALASEYASGPPFGAGAFVRRNRLIAALASVVVVVEAAARSGALTTARAAARIGRPVLAVPGDLDRPTSEGPLMLMRGGTRPCGGARDVLDALGRAADAGAGAPAAATSQSAEPDHVPGGAGGAMLSCLDRTPRTVDALARAAGLDVASALNGLLELEWAGLAHALPGARWRRAGEPA